MHDIAWLVLALSPLILGAIASLIMIIYDQKQEQRENNHN